MGLFKKIKKAVKSVPKKAVTAVKHPVSTVKSVASKALQNPARYTSAVLSGGTTELLRKAPGVGSIYGKAFDQIYAPVFDAAASYYSYGLSSQLQAILAPPPTEEPMAINLGGLLGSVGTILGGVQGQNASGIRTVGALAQIAGAAIPVSTRKPMSAPSVSTMPALSTSVVGSAVGSALTQEVVNVGSLLLGKLGIRIRSIAGFAPALKRALAGIASIARRTPGLSMVSVLMGLGFAAQSANLLVAWYHQKKRHRRMNPANSKALRRAARRIKSFHRLCMHTDVIKTSRRSSGRSRCGSCRKSPCSC